VWVKTLDPKEVRAFAKFNNINFEASQHGDGLLGASEANGDELLGASEANGDGLLGASEANGDGLLCASR